jgi:hypothetical protein
MNTTTKPSRSTTRTHTYVHRTRSGNVIRVSVTIPREGKKTHYEFTWAKGQTNGDRNEYWVFRDFVVRDVSEIAGRWLNLHDNETTFE